MHSSRRGGWLCALAVLMSIAGPTGAALAAEEVLFGSETPLRVATLLPTTLQITPGASGTLTVTLSTVRTTETLVQLSTSDPRVVGLPPEGTVTVPAGQFSQSFAVFAVSPGQATVAAALLGSSARSQVTVVVGPPTVVSLLPPSLPLTEGSTGSLTVTLNASQPTGTEVLLSTSDLATVSLPGDRVTVPANTLTTSFPVTGLSRGLATITASLPGSSATAAIEVVPPPPTLQALTCPSSLAATAPGLCTLTLNATQLTETPVALSVEPPGLVGAPLDIPVPANTLSVEFAVTALAHGVAALTAGPVNGTSRSVPIQVLPPPPTITELLPPSGTLVVGATATFTLALNAAQPTETVVPVALAPPGIASGPGTVTVPAGSLTAPVPVMGLAPGTTTLTVGPLTGTQAASRVTVTEGLPTVTTLSPSRLSLPQGKTGTLTVAIAPSVTVPAVVPLASSDPESVEVPGSITVPAGFAVAEFPVLARSEGSATITAGPLNGTSQQAAVTVTAPAVVSLTVTPPGATIAPGQPQQFTAIGTYTDGTSQDLTGSVTWSSSHEAVAVVTSPGGLATGLALGTSTITATGASAITASATLSVFAASPSGPTAAPSGTEGAGASGPGSSGVGRPSATSPQTAQVTGGGTALTGRILDTHRRPIRGVLIQMPVGAGTLETVTDANGEFLLQNPPVGDRLLLVDGEPASTAKAKYPTIPLTVTIQSGVVTRLPFTPHLHAQKEKHFTPIHPGQETVATDPDLPGVALRIPKGARIIGWDGQPNTRVSIRTVPLDRLPVPPVPPEVAARTVYMFYFGKKGGGIATQPIPFDAPNDLGLGPGEKAELWYFDESHLPGGAPNAWRKAGMGTVTSDGKLIRSDPGVGIPKFCCGAAAYNPVRGTGQALLSPFEWLLGGEPVDLSTGIFLLTAVDLVLPGRLPVVLTRTYRSGDWPLGPFGIGTTLAYDDYLQQPSPDLFFYVSAANARTPFSRQPDGSYINTTVPALRGARITVNPDGTRTLRFKDGASLVFNASGQQIASQDRAGNRVTVERATATNTSALRDPAGRALEFTWHAPQIGRRILSVRDPLGRSVQYQYGALELLEAVTNPAGGVTRYTYDAQKRLTSVTDPRGITFLQNSYDANGRVCQQLQADGSTFRFYYITADRATLPESLQLLNEAAAGGPITQAPCSGTLSSAIVVATVLVDPRGKPTTYRFNGQGYLIQVTDALGGVTTYERQDGTNLLLSVTDPLDRVTRFQYDGNGNVTSVTDPQGNVRTFTYEPTFSQVTSSVDPLGHTTSFEYDTQGNLTAITDPEQNTRPEAERLKTRFDYNTFGQPVTITDPLGHMVTLTYDAQGSLERLTDALGRTTERFYDLASRLTAQTDPSGRLTQFGYDALNHLTGIEDPLGGTTSFTYDPNGNLLSVTDPRGNTTRYTYDTMDRVATRTDPLLRAESFQHDAGGNLTQVTDRKGQVTTLSYDALNRRTQVSYADSSTTTYTHDAGDRLTQVVDSLAGTITRTYDPLDRLLSESTPQGTVSYTYDAAGRRSSMTVTGQSPVTYAYDPADHFTQLTQGMSSVSLTYDAASRRTTLTLPNGVVVEYGYDVASQLTGLTYRRGGILLGDLTYSYDGAGNRIQVGGSWARTSLPQAVGSATHDAANQLLTWGSQALTYDANGNLTGDGARTYAWNARDQLISVTGGSFAYDGLGRRVRKTVGVTTTDFLYDGLNPVQELSGGLPIANLLTGLGVDEYFTRTDTAGSRVFLPDALGSSLALTDNAGGVQTEYTYEPFGATTMSGEPSSNAFQYTGRENDGTGLYYYRARYYSPQWQRFMSEDPLGFEAGDLNSYAYTSNNPIIFGDPLGLHGFILFGRVPTIFRWGPWRLFPGQRPVPQSARPVPRQTTDPPVRPSDSPWPPEPVWREPIQHRNPLPSPIDPPCPICPNPPPPGSAPPLWPGGPTPTPPLPGAREKPPASSPAPALPPPWA